MSKRNNDIAYAIGFIFGIVIVVVIVFLFNHGDYVRTGIIIGDILACYVAFVLQSIVCKTIPKEYVFSPSLYADIKRRRSIYIYLILPLCSAICGLIYVNAVCNWGSISHDKLDSFVLWLISILTLIWLVVSMIIGVKEVSSLNKISEIAASYVSDGKACTKKGKTEKAIARFQRAINIYQLYFDDDSLGLAAAYINMHIVYLEISANDTAREYVEKAFAIYEKKGEPFIPVLANCYFLIGNTFDHIVDKDDALFYYEKALDILLNLPDKDEDSISDVYDSIAELEYINGNYSRALDYYEKTLDIKKRILKDDDPDLAAIYTKAGIMNWIFADYVRAKVLFERGLYLREKYQPKNLLSIAESYDYLGMCYVEQGELENARQCFNKVNNISTSFAKEDATSIFSSLYVNIGAIYSAQNDYKKALEYYLKALDLLEKIENEDKGALLICNANIAESYCQLGNINKADYYANKAKVIYEDNPIKIYPFSSELSILLGLICSSKNELVNALSYFESALEERKQQLGPNHPYTALAHYQIGRVYKKQGDFVKAKEYLDNAKKIQEKCFNPNHYALTKTLNEFEGLTS